MYSELPVGLFELRQALDKAALFHRVGSIRDDTVLIEVRLPTSFWEIEFFSDERVECEVFRSTGPILDRRGLIELVMQWWDHPLPQAALDRQLSELTVMRLLREADIYFCADELLMRKIMVEGAVMIEVAVPSERWEIDVLANGEIEVERFRSEDGVGDFDAKALRELLASAGQVAPNRRKGLRN